MTELRQFEGKARGAWLSSQTIRKKLYAARMYTERHMGRP